MRQAPVTIRPGEPWGDVGPVPAGLVTVHSDAELRDVVERARRLDAPLPPVGVAGGDLMRAVGGTGETHRFDTGDGVDVARLPVDIVRVEAGGEVAWFVAQLIARRSWWRGELVAAMNAQYRGVYDIAPRAHPNDGRADVVRVAAAMSVGDRWKARRRLPQGTHVPHPAITTRPASTIEITFERPLDVWLDGMRWRRCTALRLTVEPDALTVCV